MGGGPIRAAVMADTHGVLRPEVEQILETCDVIIHAGDFDNQMLYHKLEVNQPLYAVRGNNDRGWSGGLSEVRRFELGGVKFIMAHERTDIPSTLTGIQVIIFGHSHMYYQQEINGRLWLNPGSCGYKRFTLPLSMAVMTIEDGTYEVETVWLEKGYGTPGAALAQMEQSKMSRYEKQQRRYKKKAGKEKLENELAENVRAENDQTENVQEENDQVRNGQVENGRVRNGQAENSQVRNGQAENSRVRNGQAENSQLRNGQAENSRDRNGQAENSQVRNAQVENSRDRNGQAENAQVRNAQPDPAAERDRLFMIAKIQRLIRAGESREWIIKNLGTEMKWSGAIYDICYEYPGDNARRILELLKERII